MERERQTVMLAAVTLLMYGLVSFLGNGPFAFFPINEIVFFGIVAYFSFFHFRTAPISYTFMLLIALLGLANNQLFLGLFMDNAQFETYYNSSAPDYIRLGIYALIFAEITRFYLLTKWKMLWFTFPLIAGLFIAGIWQESLLLNTVALTLFVGILHYLYKKQMAGIAIYSKSLFYLWYILVFLKLTTLLTIYLYEIRFE